MVYIGADHAGFEMKEQIKKFLSVSGAPFVDLGALAFDKNDDYPDFAHAVAKAVSKKRNSRGILVCGSGQGVCIAANKIKGARAALAWSVATARASRIDDDANILCLSARYLKLPMIRSIIAAWLETPFSGHLRHKRRLRKIEAL